MNNFGLVILGAHTGEYLKDLIKNHINSKILLVEPVPYNFELLEKEYKAFEDIIICKKAILNCRKKDKTFERIYDIVEKVMIEKKNIHPNVDYPTGPTYHLMGFDTDFFTPIFVISRITGWSAHIMEQLAANKLIRPLAAYNGSKHRQVISLNKR